MRFLFFLLLCSHTLFGAQSSSQNGIFFTGSIWGGVWESVFSQSGFGQTSTTTKTTATPGIELTFGLRSPSLPVFGEFNQTFLLGSQPKSKRDDESEYTEFGILIGLCSQNFPFEPFIGFGQGTYTFENGSPLSFSGNSVALGMNVVIGGRANTWHGIRIAARYLNADQDTAGKINTNYKTTFMIYSAGLYFAF